EHLDHVEELLPVRAPELLERAPADAEALRERLKLAPLAIAPRLGAPGAPVALDRRERGLGPLRPLTFQELRDGQPRELGGEMAQSAAVASAVARHGEGRRGPEDPLDDPALRADDGAVGQERVDEHTMAADRVDAEDQREARRALAPDERQSAGLGFRDGPFRSEERRVGEECG